MGLDKLKQGLAGEQARPEIRRGQGVRLSTEEPTAEPQERTNAQTHKKEEPKQKVERTNRGVALRIELIDDLKLVATIERRHLYEVMEEAMEAFLESKREMIQAYLAKRGGRSDE